MCSSDLRRYDIKKQDGMRERGDRKHDIKKHDGMRERGDRKHDIKKQDGMRERGDRKEIREAEREKKMTKGRNGNQTCGGHSGIETVFSPSTAVSPVSIIPPHLHLHVVVPGQTGEAWEPSKKHCPSGYQAVLDSKVPSTFRNVCTCVDQAQHVACRWAAR